MPLSALQDNFTIPLLQWFDLHGRHDLPWQTPRLPYSVYLSEIMLQQTHVQTVIPYFERFIKRFPSLQDLADAPEEDVLTLWSGLGYYARARNLHKTAKILCTEFSGQFPTEPEQLKTLPGIGASTAAAIASLAFHRPVAILDGNVKRVLARYFKIPGALNHPSTEKTLRPYAEQCVSPERASDYTQAIMDLGALCCKKTSPLCHHCPVHPTCLAFQTHTVEEFPHPSPKKTLPSKTSPFFIIQCTDPLQKTSVCLEKRPDKGIWGGLWCLPMQAPSSHTEQILFCTHKHVFTHFRLTMHVYLLTSLVELLVTPHTQWITAEQLPHIGVPAPIRYLLGVFFENLDAHYQQHARSFG